MEITAITSVTVLRRLRMLRLLRLRWLLRLFSVIRYLPRLRNWQNAQHRPRTQSIGDHLEAKHNNTAIQFSQLVCVGRASENG